MTCSRLAAATALALAAPAAATPDLITETGSSGVPIGTAPLRAPTTLTVTANGLTVNARKLIVGTGSTGTATASPPGNPIYNPAMPRHSGVAQLSMRFAGGGFVCSGALMQDRIHVLTAAHCVSDGAGTPNPLATTVRFYGGSDPDTLVSGLSGSSSTHATLSAAAYFVHPDYTGQVVDQNDIAIIRLTEAAPNWVQSYRIAPLGNLAGVGFELAGYGGRSTGGNIGAVFGTGRLRTGENAWDFRFGDNVFDGFWDRPNPRRPGSTNYFGTAEIAHSWVSDFDGPNGANNTSCLLTSGFTGSFSSRWCDPAVGLREASTAGGDSGGPSFVNGRLAGIASYGISFGPAIGDVDSRLNSSFGELAGVVPLYIHRDFIAATTGLAVPDPASWALLIAGFGLVGASLRRRRALGLQA